MPYIAPAGGRKPQTEHLSTPYRQDDLCLQLLQRRKQTACRRTQVGCEPSSRWPIHQDVQLLADLTELSPEPFSLRSPSSAKRRQTEGSKI